MSKNFYVAIDIDRSGKTTKYFVYKCINGEKLWVTKDKKLDRYIWAKAHVKTWDEAVEIANQILRGEIA